MHARCIFSGFSTNFGTAFLSLMWALGGVGVERTAKGSYSPRGVETAFSESLLRTLLGSLFHCKTHSRVKPNFEDKRLMDTWASLMRRA